MPRLGAAAAYLNELPRRVPFFYGWVIVGCALLAAFARQGSAVATLSVFITPMTETFGWSRTAFSGAVSLGGVLAAVIAPWVGATVDRHGARVVLTLGAFVIGAACLGLSLTTSLVWFYVAFALGRLTFASPFDIGISAAIANWFLDRRAQAMSYVTVGSTIGLAVLPMLAYLVIETAGWRAAWVVLAATVVLIGALPSVLFMRRRPEDVGLLPDGGEGDPTAPLPPRSSRSIRACAGATAHSTGPEGRHREVPTPSSGDDDSVPLAGNAGSAGAKTPSAGPDSANPSAPGVASSGYGAEPRFTRAEAVRTPAFWLLMAYSALIYPVQAGISLHQAPHIIEQGLSAGVAASVVSTYSLLAAVFALVFGLIGRRWPVRVGLALAAGMMSVAAMLMLHIESAALAFLSAGLFGGGMGGVMTLLPVAWANYFGRANFGAIRGITLPVQVFAQAMGPLLAGALYDWDGSYTLSLTVLGSLGVVATGIVLFALPPLHARR